LLSRPETGKMIASIIPRCGRVSPARAEGKHASYTKVSR
jgi:hypothetical protein